MKPIYSALAAAQTVETRPVTPRVAVRKRQWTQGDCTETTNDVLVDGAVYTPAVGKNRLSQILPRICDITARKTGETHIGHGQWVCW